MGSEKYIAVVGGVNIDIGGTPDSPLIPEDSNPGRVTVSMGGVGRNIAENLCRMGRRVKMITALGEDANADAVIRNANELGMDITDSIRVPGGRTSTYLCLNDETGDVLAAISDMSIYDTLTPEMMKEKLPVLNQAAAVIVDTNLPEAVLTYLADNLKVPLLADTVSVKKSVKLKGALPCLTAIKPNRPEASRLTGIEITCDGDVPKVARALVEMGVKNVFLSKGGNGVYYDNGTDCGTLPCFPRPIVNTSGCGDAFLAAAADALADGLDIRSCARRGLAASALCAATDSAVNPMMNKQDLLALAEC